MGFEEWMNEYNNALLKETAFKIRNLFGVRFIRYSLNVNQKNSKALTTGDSGFVICKNTKPKLYFK